MRRNDVIRGLAVLRAGVGAGLVVAPGLAGRIWVGEDAAGRGTRVLARALGARDLVLGTTALRSLADQDEVAAARLTQLGVLADGADLMATLVAGRHLTGHRRWSMPLIAAAVGAVGGSVWRIAEDTVERGDDELHPASDTGPRAPGAPVRDVGRVGIDDQRRATLADAGAVVETIGG